MTKKEERQITLRMVEFFIKLDEKFIPSLNPSPKCLGICDSITVTAQHYFNMPSVKVFMENK